MKLTESNSSENWWWHDGYWHERDFFYKTLTIKVNTIVQDATGCKDDRGTYGKQK